jgi:hypothetical protein
MAFRYRDKRTGRFTSEAKWKKHKVSKGGYVVREAIVKPYLPEPDELLPEPEEVEDMMVDGTELLPTIADIDDWLAAYEMADEYDLDEYEGGIDTGRKD